MDRDKLIETINKIPIFECLNIDYGKHCQDCDFANANNMEVSFNVGVLADALIANGIDTTQKQIDNAMREMEVDVGK